MFTLQLGHPKIQRVTTREFPSVSDVFTELFRGTEESIYLFWHTIPIALRYREDLCANIDELIAINWMLQKEPEGKMKAGLSNQLLQIDWNLYWKEDELTIDARFHPHEGLYGAYAVSLNQAGGMTLSRTAFLSEWKTLLHQVLVAFEAGNITIADGTERRKLELLERTEETISDYGQLYTR